MHAQLKSASNIKALTALHELILEKRTDFETNKDKLIQYNIGFDYSIGTLYSLERIYTVDYYFLRDSKELKTIYESEEFKNMHSLQNLNYKKITSITFSNPANYDTPVTIKNPNDIAILLKLMDEDYAAETYSEAMSLDWPYAIASINYNMEDRTSKKIVSSTTDLVIRESYMKTIGWLAEKGLADKIALTDDMISYISVYSPDLNSPEVTNEYMSAPGKYITESVSTAYEFKITDKTQISEAMKMGKSQNISNFNYYYGTIFYDFPGKTGINGYEVTQAIYFNPKEVPDFIKNHFK